MITKEWKAQSRTRIDLFLREQLKELFPDETHLSNSKIRRLIIAGSISVNGRQCRVPSYEVFAGSTVRAQIDKEKFLYEKPTNDIDFTLTQENVLFEDEDLIIVNKPAFLPTEETMVQGRKNLHQCVVDYLWSKNPSLRNPPYAGIMHRLDLETSGAILFTKTRKVNPAIHKMFEERSIKKTYTAVCFPKKIVGSERTKSEEIKIKEKFSVEGIIYRASKKSEACKMALTQEEKKLPPNVQGDFSSTDFELISKTDDGRYILLCHLNTGRTHQIRVHLSSVGFPIAGDTLYGSTKSFADNNDRIMLHSCQLEFTHPVTGQTLTVKAPLPEHFSV